MRIKEEIAHKLIGLLLILALVLPSAIQFSHLFEDHEHQVCTEHSVHIHKKEVECPICDYHISTFTFQPLPIDDSIVVKAFRNNTSYQLFLLQQETQRQLNLRGPPLFS